MEGTDRRQVESLIKRDIEALLISPEFKKAVMAVIEKNKTKKKPKKEIGSGKEREVSVNTDSEK